MTKKQVVISIVSIALMLLICIYYTVAIKTISVASIGARFFMNNTLITDDFRMVDSVFNQTILIDLSVFSIIQLFCFTMYLLNKKKVLRIAFIIELVLLIVSIVEIITYSPDVLKSMYSIPAVNILLYLIGLKGKNEKDYKKISSNN